MRRKHTPERPRPDPDADPVARCSDCGASYNPYKFGLGNCPHCTPSENDVPVVDPSDYVEDD
jgi:hypothetical protein